MCVHRCVDSALLVVRNKDESGVIASAQDRFPALQIHPGPSSFVKSIKTANPVYNKMENNEL